MACLICSVRRNAQSLPDERPIAQHPGRYRLRLVELVGIRRGAWLDVRKGIAHPEANPHACQQKLEGDASPPYRLRIATLQPQPRRPVRAANSSRMSMTSRATNTRLRRRSVVSKMTPAAVS